MKTRIVYLVHFAEPYKHSRHYIGSTCDLPARLQEHRAGTGARLLAVVNEAGIAWEVVRQWKGTRKDERKLKNRHNARRLCPVCAGDNALKRARKL